LRNVRSDRVRQSREELLFLKKKKQKDFRSCGLWQRQCNARRTEGFLGAIFSKKAGLKPCRLHLVQEWLGHANMTTTAIDADTAGAEENELARGM